MTNAVLQDADPRPSQSRDMPHFNNKILQMGITFDDVLVLPRFSEIVPSEVRTSTRLTRRISLNIPIISAPMDTVTESELAIALAKTGGLGVIHKNMSIESQCEEVRRVKRSANGIIDDPITLPPDQSRDPGPRDDGSAQCLGHPDRAQLMARWWAS